MWNPCEEADFDNEIHFVGPHKLLAHAQMEANQLGKHPYNWIVHGWDLTVHGWVICLVRTKHKDEEEKESIHGR